MRTAAHIFVDELSPQVDHRASVYRYATRSGGIATAEQVALDLGLGLAEVADAISRLAESGLLRPGPGAAGALVPVDPEVAAMLLISPVEREIYQRHELIARIRAHTEAFRDDYASVDRPERGAAPVGHIAGTAAVRGYLKVVGDGCLGEVIVLEPGKQDPAQFDHILQVCGGLLERGVSVRILCAHRSRADLVSGMKIKHVADSGASVRTASHIPRAAVVADRSLAVLMGTGDGGEATAATVRDPSTVHFLMDLFDHLWDDATPVSSPKPGYAEAVDDLHQSIACLMAKGFTDEVIARKLGMSVRTCRRHIANLMHDLDAVSRFQAGARAVRRQLVAEA